MHGAIPRTLSLPHDATQKQTDLASLKQSHKNATSYNTISHIQTLKHTIFTDCCSMVQQGLHLLLTVLYLNLRINTLELKFDSYQNYRKNKQIVAV